MSKYDAEMAEDKAPPTKMTRAKILNGISAFEWIVTPFESRPEREERGVI